MLNHEDTMIAQAKRNANYREWPVVETEEWYDHDAEEHGVIRTYREPVTGMVVKVAITTVHPAYVSVRTWRGRII